MNDTGRARISRTLRYPRRAVVERWDEQGRYRVWHYERLECGHVLRVTAKEATRGPAATRHCHECGRWFRV